MTSTTERDRYLTDGVRERIRSLETASVDVSQLERAYVLECEHFREFLRSDTPDEVIRRCAFQKVEREFSE